MRVTIRGTTYESVSEAAQALGMSRSYIYKAVDEGRQDLIGIGSGRWRKPGDKFEGNKIVLHGVEFPSMKAASLALGFNEHYVRSVFRRGSPKATERVKFAVMRYISKMEMKSARER